MWHKYVAALLKDADIIEPISRVISRLFSKETVVAGDNSLGTFRDNCTPPPQGVWIKGN